MPRWTTARAVDVEADLRVRVVVAPVGVPSEVERTGRVVVNSSERMERVSDGFLLLGKWSFKGVELLGEERKIEEERKEMEEVDIVAVPCLMVVVDMVVVDGWFCFVIVYIYNLF